MERPAIFKDSEGAQWHIAMKYGDLLRVRCHVQGADNTPLDLCYIAETGDFKQVTDHIDILVRAVYWLLYNSIQEYSGKSGIEAQEWFYNRIDSNTLTQIVTAFYEAIINFTPFPVVRTAMLTAGEMITRAEIVTQIELLAGQLERCTNTPELSASTPPDSVTAN